MYWCQLSVVTVVRANRSRHSRVEGLLLRAGILLTTSELSREGSEEPLGDEKLALLGSL